MVVFFKSIIVYVHESDNRYHVRCFILGDENQYPMKRGEMTAETSEAFSDVPHEMGALSGPGFKTEVGALAIGVSKSRPSPLPNK